MEFVGIIQATPDPPGIDRSEWIALIKARDDPVPPEPRTVVNPFTKKRVTIDPLNTSADAFVTGQCVGSFHWSQNHENVVGVWGDLTFVRPVAEEIASELGGVFLTADEREQ